MSILLNSNITTPVSSNVIEAMKPFLNSAIDLKSLTKPNQKALKAYKEALNKVYLSIGAKDEDSIILTSSASEATSQIFLSIYLKYILTGRKNSIIVSERAPIEEIKIVRFLESQGCRVYEIPTTADGTVDVDILKEYVNSKTALVSIPMVDDESGVIQPIEEVSTICQLQGVPLYCNATHAIGKIPISVERTPIDFLSFDGSTIFAPKDIGALYIKKDAIEIMPLIFGLDSEQSGLREEPKDIAKVVGFAKALEDAIDALDFDMEDVRDLRDEFEEQILQIDGVYSLAPWALRVPNVSIFAIEGVHASILLERLAKKDIVAYSFSTFERRHFERKELTEIAALDSSLKFCVIGFSLSILNTKEEIEIAIAEIKSAIDEVRNRISGDVCKEKKWVN